jgi:hypothetical protein
MAYSSASDVVGWCHNVLGSASMFSEATDPTLGNVESWLSSGCAVIETQLQSWGYSVPVAATAGAYQWLKDLNTLYAAARVEMSRTNITLGPGERTRGQVMDEWFWRDLDRLQRRDLSTAGVSRSSTGKLYVGGVSQSDKATWDQDSDRVKPRFRKGMFETPGTTRAGTISAS